jgi:hypothetical protein
VGLLWGGHPVVALDLLIMHLVGHLGWLKMDGVKYSLSIRKLVLEVL